MSPRQNIVSQTDEISFDACYVIVKSILYTIKPVSVINFTLHPINPEQGTHERGYDIRVPPAKKRVELSTRALKGPPRKQRDILLSFEGTQSQTFLVGALPSTQRWSSVIQAAEGLPFNLAEDAAESLHTTNGGGRGHRTAGVFTF